MKKLLLLLALIISFTTSQAQSLNEVFSKYIQPNSTTDELREGLQKIEELCSLTPQEKCNKAKASALYLLANDYYGAAYNVYFVDAALANPILEKAKLYYDMAYKLMPIESFTEVQKNTMLDQKNKLESNPTFKLAQG